MALEDVSEQEQALVRQAMSIVGRRKTERKAQASAENGKKGGRPKGTPMSQETKARIAATRRANQEQERAANLARAQEATE